jgi:adenosylcobinamide-phosphate synthase
MKLEYQVLAAVALDLVLGDPRWLPHPVKTIGWLALRLEPLARRLVPHSKAAGVVTAFVVYCTVGAVAWTPIELARLAHPAAADVACVVLIYTSIAARDLARHSMAVLRPLVIGDLDRARRSLSMIVGRDTGQLDEAGVVRAAVESVAESTVDGVTAPLFWAIVAGPVGAIVYRAINTLDSIFGHTSVRYREFGWASARIDDLANYLPARLTAPLVSLAAILLRQRPGQSLRVLLRDGRKHASPNSGLTEAAMAGALGVQLGGASCYGGEPVERPTIGEPLTPLSAAHIRAANRLMFVTAGLFLAAGLGLRGLALHLWCAARVAA